MKRIILLFILLSFKGYASTSVQLGQTFPVIEMDFRQFIALRLNQMKQSGEFDELKQKTIARVAESVQRPKPLNLSMATKSKVYYVSPEITVSRDIRLPNGQLLVAKGTKINPMNRVKINSVLFFFNADDVSQLNWAKANYQKYQLVKFILTGGDVKQASEVLGRVYFDQEGKLTKKLKIEQVPAIATQEHNQWKIQVIGEKEYAND